MGDPDRRDEDRLERTCAATGLHLIATRAQHAVRIARESYGPLNPILRDTDTIDVTDWGRWDTRGGRTIYAASNSYVAFLEILAYQAPAVGLAQTPATEAFPDDDPSSQTVLDKIRADWDQQVSWEPGKISKGWRTSRTLYTLTLPPTGWVVDVEHGDTLIAINRGMATQLQELGLSRLDRGHLTGQDRRITTAVAAHLRRQVLDDGTYPHGIGYPSKHSSTAWCWALWLRKVDDGFDTSHEPTLADEGHPIDSVDQNPPLREAARALNLYIY